MVALWKWRAATGPEARHHLSHRFAKCWWVGLGLPNFTLNTCKIQSQDPPNHPETTGFVQNRGFGVQTPSFVAWGPKTQAEQADQLQYRGFGPCRLRGLPTIYRVLYQAQGWRETSSGGKHCPLGGGRVGASWKGTAKNRSYIVVKCRKVSYDEMTTTYYREWTKAPGSESAARICPLEVPSKKRSLRVIFSPRNYRENAHSKSANFEGRHSGGHLLGRPLLFISDIRTVSEYCSARVSRVGLSTKSATEPYSDNLLNRTRNTSEPYSDKEIPLRRALRRLLVSWVLNWNPPKIRIFTTWNRTRNRTRTPPDLWRFMTLYVKGRKRLK